MRNNKTNIYIVKGYHDGHNWYICAFSSIKKANEFCESLQDLYDPWDILYIYKQKLNVPDSTETTITYVPKGDLIKKNVK